MAALNILLLFIATVIAFWISAICGGGASLVLIPVLNLMLPVSVIPFSLTIGTLTSSASRIVVFKKNINWKIAAWFIPFSVPAVLFGAYLIKYINAHYLQLIVALLLISNIPQLFKKHRNMVVSGRLPRITIAITGFLAGFVSGVTGAIGLLFNRFYLKFGLSKEEIIATRAANEVFLHLIKLGIYIALGLYSPLALGMGLTIAAASVISSYTVKFILPYLSEKLFRKIGYFTMVLSGFILLGSTASNIIRQDNITFKTVYYKDKTESIVSWRSSDLVLEYDIGEGLEVERPVHAEELPVHLKVRYLQLSSSYDTIYIEKVFTIGKPPSYEFYCYKNKALTKIDFK